MVNAIEVIGSSNVASVSLDNEVKNPELPKHLGVRPWDSLADARKNYENALKSGSLENILEASKKLTEVQMELNPNAPTSRVVNIGSPIMTDAQVNLLKAQDVYEKAAKANNIDEMITAQKNLAKAQFDVGVDSFKKTVADAADDVADAPTRKGIWNSIKAHPWLAGLVLFSVALGACMATKKDKATIKDID